MHLMENQTLNSMLTLFAMLPFLMVAWFMKVSGDPSGAAPAAPSDLLRTLPGIPFYIPF